MMDELLVRLAQTSGIDSLVQARLLKTLVAFVVIWGLYQILKRAFINNIEDPMSRYRWRKVAQYLFLFLGVVALALIWSANYESLATFLGLLSAGLAIALREPLTDLVGWVFILSRKPFAVGDRVQIGTHTGDVIDIGMFDFSLMEVGNWVEAEQSTGRILHIPNSQIFTTALANYTAGYGAIWNEVQVVLTPASNWEKARRLLEVIAAQYTEPLDQSVQERLRKADSHYMIQAGRLQPTVYMSVIPRGIALTLRYLCEPRKRRDSTQQLWQLILEAFAAHPDIVIKASP
jgi:small-conductance mechanosensitive channel